MKAREFLTKVISTTYSRDIQAKIFCMVKDETQAEKVSPLLSMEIPENQIVEKVKATLEK